MKRANTLSPRTSLRINMIDIKDYYYMRYNDMPSNVQWNYVKNLVMENGLTFWQNCKNLDLEYIPEYEPSKRTLETIRGIFNFQIPIKNI